MKVKNGIRTALLLTCMLIACFMLLPYQKASAAIRLNIRSATIVKGESVQLSIKGTKSKVKWSSNDKNIASVSKTGKVTAKSVGSTSITAIVKKKQYACVIEVVDLICRTDISTEDGGDLITSIDSSKSVLDISLSAKVKSLAVQVFDEDDNLVKNFDYSDASEVKCIWDLTDLSGNKVKPGKYYYVITTAGFYLKTNAIEIYDSSEFASGNGSVINPYEVTNFEQLKRILFHDGKSFIQTADINVNYEKYNPLFTIDAPFTGEYDGNGHKINNIVVDAAEDYIALFSAVGEKGVIKNLNISESSFKGNTYVGAIAGHNNGEILNCNIQNTDVLSESSNTGAVCGSNNGNITDCTTTQVTVTSKKGCSGAVTGDNAEKGTISSHRSSNDNIKGNNAGGIAGQNEGNIGKSEVTNANIITNELQYVRSGGITALNYGVITECKVSSCQIEADSYILSKDAISSVGGISGYNKGTVSSCNVVNSQLFGKSVAANYYNDSNSYIGGLAGDNEGTVISGQVVSCNISGSANRKLYIGGIIGKNSGNNSRNIYDGTLNQIGHQED